MGTKGFPAEGNVQGTVGKRKVCSGQGRSPAWLEQKVHVLGEKMEEKIGLSQTVNGLICSAQNGRYNYKGNKVATDSRTKK